MRLVPLLVVVLTLAAEVRAQEVRRDVPYADKADEQQVLDVYAPKGAKGLPVVFWIHGGGWQAGDKADVQVKPQAFTDKGFVFVSTNYRLLPAVDMGTIVRDVAQGRRLDARARRRVRRRPEAPASSWATPPGPSSPPSSAPTTAT